MRWPWLIWRECRGSRRRSLWDQRPLHRMLVPSVTGRERRRRRRPSRRAGSPMILRVGKGVCFTTILHFDVKKCSRVIIGLDYINLLLRSFPWSWSYTGCKSRKLTVLKLVLTIFLISIFYFTGANIVGRDSDFAEPLFLRTCSE